MFKANPDQTGPANPGTLNTASCKAANQNNPIHTQTCTKLDKPPPHLLIQAGCPVQFSLARAPEEQFNYTSQRILSMKNDEEKNEALQPVIR